MGNYEGLIIQINELTPGMYCSASSGSITGHVVIFLYVAVCFSSLTLRCYSPIVCSELRYEYNIFLLLISTGAERGGVGGGSHMTYSHAAPFFPA